MPRRNDRKSPRSPRSLTRSAVRDFAGDTVAVIHARSYTQASSLAARDGLPVNELEDCGPSHADTARVERTPEQYVLVLPETPINLDDDPTPLSGRLHELDGQGHVLAFAEDGGTISHLLRLKAQAAQEVLHLAQHECPGASLLDAATTRPTDPQQYAPLQAEGVHVRTWGPS
jgi:hypothetical protein